MNIYDPEHASQANVNGYDSLMFWPPLLEYYCHSDFVNYGYWREGTRDAREASENLMEELLALIPEKRGTILDVACGKGATTRYLKKYYHLQSITGINVSEVQLKACRENMPDGKFLLMDAVDMKFDAHSFDTVICVEAAFHFKTRERFFHEAYRILKPGGYLVLSDILLSQEAEGRRKFRTEKNYVKNLQEYEQILRSAGFPLVNVIDVTKPCFHGCFWHLVRFSHEKLLTREIDAAALRAFVRRFFEFVPEIRYYLLASARKGG